MNIDCTAYTTRVTCIECRQPFDAETFIVAGHSLHLQLCEKCEIDRQQEVVAPERRPIPLGATWPQRHADAVKDYTGPAYALARKLWDSHVASGDCTIVLYGKRGLGKTGIAVQWAHMRGLAGRKPGTYCTAYELFARIRRSWHPSSTEAEWDALKPYVSAPYLVIDQMHQCRALSGGDDKAAGWERMALAELLDARYRNGSATVLVATLTTKDELIKAFDPDILARVGETGGLVHCDWPSYR